MCKPSMQEHISNKLIEPEVASQEKMQAKHGGQIYATALKNIGSYKRQNIDDKQILGHCRYIVHLTIF